MYTRSLQRPDTSFFLFGPRGTGKSTWVRSEFRDAVFVDLLESEVFNALVASPQRLEGMVPRGHEGWVIIDEVQKVPAILDEVHREIELHGRRFALTGSSTRKLKATGVNLLAGRARTQFMYPLTAAELGADFSPERALRFGCLPSVYAVPDPAAYLASYVTTCLKEEIQQEGLTRNLGAFSRFLEAASFSQGALLNMSLVARDCGVHRKVVEQYFVTLEDLLLAERLPAFTRRAQRQTTTHPKFYFFDAGVYRTIRPRGPLDSSEEIDGAALETLVYQQLRAIDAYRQLGYKLHYWRTTTGLEVDFVLYGERGIKAIEVTRAHHVRPKDLKGLMAFVADYPMAEACLVYGGARRYHEAGFEIVPVGEFLRELEDRLS